MCEIFCGPLKCHIQFWQLYKLPSCVNFLQVSAKGPPSGSNTTIPAMSNNSTSFNGTNNNSTVNIPHKGPPLFNTTLPTNDTSSVGSPNDSNGGGNDGGSDNGGGDNAGSSAGGDISSSTDNSTTTTTTESSGGSSTLNASVILLITFPLVALAAYYAMTLTKKARETKEGTENVESHRMISAEDMESPSAVTNVIQEPVHNEDENDITTTKKGISHTFSRTSGYSQADSEEKSPFEHPPISI